jgi:hypothetical protein
LTNPDGKKKLVERILKLFQLGDSSKNQSEAEVFAAIAKARELMAQHDLTDADILAAGTEKAKKVLFTMTQDAVYTRKGRTFAVYDNSVAAAVNEICGTKSYTQSRHSDRNGWTVSRIFYGTEADVAVANALFHALLDTVRRSARETFGTGWSPEHQSYAIGFADRLYHRAVKWRPELALTAHQSTALAVIEKDKNDQIEKWAEKHLPALKTRKPRKRKVQADAYEQGYEDGGTVDLGDPRRRVK